MRADEPGVCVNWGTGGIRLHSTLWQHQFSSGQRASEGWVIANHCGNEHVLLLTVCVYAHTRMPAHAHARICACPHTQGTKDNVGCLPLSSSTLCLRQCHSLNLKFADSLDWLASKPQGFFSLCKSTSRAGITDANHCVQRFCK